MTYTRLFMTAAMITIALYDLVAVTFFGVDGSVSRWFQETGFNQPFIILVIGFLLGHFFGYMPPKWYPQPTKTIEDTNSSALEQVVLDLGHEGLRQLLSSKVGDLVDIKLASGGTVPVKLVGPVLMASKKTKGEV